jgi:hypothetical protein
MGKLLTAYPSLEKYMARLEQRPAYKRSIERGGPVRLTEDTKALCGCAYGEFGEYAHHLQDLIGFLSELHALRIDLVADEIGPPGESLTGESNQFRSRVIGALFRFSRLLAQGSSCVTQTPQLLQPKV